MVELSPDAALAALLPEATQRLVRGVDELHDAEYAEPSHLPGWTRGHVVAHLALNAEGLAGAVRGILEGERVPMYRTDSARDDDIDELAGAQPAVLRERLLAGCTGLAEAIDALPADQRATTIERTPGGRIFTAGNVAGMRLFEVEIHHADLNAGYGPSDWPVEFSVRLLERMVDRGPTTASFTLRADDVDRAWIIGDGGPVISGSAADLAWWLAGRGAGQGVTSGSGELPQIGAW